ncbi:MAG: hypothetical protein LUO92_04030 [Methanothrix sp.]|nr:hypothetical protein [Methanothrix sp.]
MGVPEIKAFAVSLQSASLAQDEQAACAQQARTRNKAGMAIIVSIFELFI